MTLSSTVATSLGHVLSSADAGPKADFAEHGIADRGEIVHQARLMAYRREPAMVELEDDMRGQ